MSIIDDALKKTQQQLSRAESATLADSPRREVSEHGKSAMASASRQPKFNWTFLIFFILLLALLMVQVLHPLKYKQHMQARAQAAALTKAPVKGTAATGLSLKGIMASGNQRLALINQSTYAVGDRVDGYLVYSIAESGVVLQRDGRMYHLTVS